MRFFFLLLFLTGITFSDDSPYMVILGIAQDGGS
ncbi:uncharacterized protein METZ01_LOCUS133549, partial [marine metagenome]